MNYRMIAHLMGAIILILAAFMTPALLVAVIYREASGWSFLVTILGAALLGFVLTRLRPDFNEKAYGCPTFYKLLLRLAGKFGDLHVKNDNFNVMVSLENPAGAEAAPQLTRDNWKEAFAAQLQAYKDGGFERVNPSILKADILTNYPDFNERAIGFKRFSDVMKQLEKDALVVVEMDEQKTMLIKLL